MKRAHLLAGAADRATMVDGCPLGAVAAATSRAIFGTPSTSPLTHDHALIGAAVGLTPAVTTMFQNIYKGAR